MSADAKSTSQKVEIPISKTDAAVKSERTENVKINTTNNLIT